MDLPKWLVEFDRCSRVEHDGHFLDDGGQIRLADAQVGMRYVPGYYDYFAQQTSIHFANSIKNLCEQ